MRKRTTDVKIAFVIFLLCCLLSFFEKDGSDWMQVLVSIQ